MASFEDAQGRLWSVRFDVETISRIRDRCGLDLLTVMDDQAALMVRLETDMVLLVDCLFEAAETTTPVDAADFPRGLAGDVLWSARCAFWEGLNGFFGDPAQRRNMTLFRQKAEQLGAILANQTHQTLEAIDPQQLAQTLGAPSGSLPESSASTPTPTPSENLT